jgi:integration host factor subunit beta
MTRSELIQVVSMKQSQLSYKETEAAVKYIFDQMTEALGQGYRIEIRGFGSFSVRFRLPRMARNPKTGAYVHKEGKYSLRFKPGKEMRERVNISADQHPLVNMEDTENL